MLEIVHSASGVGAGKLLGRQDTVAPEKLMATKNSVKKLIFSENERVIMNFWPNVFMFV